MTNQALYFAINGRQICESPKITQRFQCSSAFNLRSFSGVLPSIFVLYSKDFLLVVFPIFTLKL